jgi:hypothetical protein
MSLGKLNIVVIYVEYDHEKYPDSFEHLRSYLVKLDDRRIKYLRVNNKDEGNGTKDLGGNVTYLQGDNVDREFSGWQRGIGFLRDHELPCDVVLFANEAFEAIGPSYLKNRNPKWLILKSHALRAVIGLVDTGWEKTRLHGKGTRVWMNTNSFFVPGSLLSKLRTLVTVDDESLTEFLPEHFPSQGLVFKQTAPMNDAYKDRMMEWLTKEWHNKIDLNERTWSIFRSKVKAILNEASLAIRIRELGYVMLPYSIPLFVLRKIRGAYRRARKILLRSRQDSARDTVITEY